MPGLIEQAAIGLAPWYIRWPVKLLIGGKKLLGTALRWAGRNPWQAAVLLLCGLCVGGYWHYSGKVEKLTGQLAAANAKIKDMTAQAKAANKSYRSAETKLATGAATITKEKNDAIKGINDRLAVALDELRRRPSRSSAPAATASTPADGQAFTGATGAQLFREDAGFLVREAARADTVRESLKACYVQYDAARDMLAEFALPKQGQ